MKCGILMDPIANINIKKDTSFALLLEAQRRDFDNYYMEPQSIYVQDNAVYGRMAKISVEDNSTHWYDLSDYIDQPLSELDLLFMRKDPPFDMQYVYLTYLLEQAKAQGLLVVNNPTSLRDANEKLFALHFPQCCPKTLVSSEIELIKDFIHTEKEVILKPLDGMGGGDIFYIKAQDRNINVIIESLVGNQRLIMVQRYIPEIRDGDKRLLMINGEPIGYALARIPAQGDFRGNLAKGASSEGRELTDRDRWICEQVGPTLREKGLYFVGLDVIGDYLTEINVTSPTCVRELDRVFNINIAGQLFDQLLK